MDPSVEAAIDQLLERGRWRGFVTMAELQHELEAVDAPGSAFDRAVDNARKSGVTVVEEESNGFDNPANEQGTIPVSDPIRMYFNQIGRVPLLTPTRRWNWPWRWKPVAMPKPSCRNSKQQDHPGR